MENEEDIPKLPSGFCIAVWIGAELEGYNLYNYLPFFISTLVPQSEIVQQ